MLFCSLKTSWTFDIIHNFLLLRKTATNMVHLGTCTKSKRETINANGRTVWSRLSVECHQIHLGLLLWWLTPVCLLWCCGILHLAKLDYSNLIVWHFFLVFLLNLFLFFFFLIFHSFSDLVRPLNIRQTNWPGQSSSDEKPDPLSFVSTV